VSTLRRILFAMHLLIASAALGTVLEAPAPSPLALRLVPRKGEVLVGEPTIKTSYVVGATGSITGGYRLAFPRVGHYRLVAKYRVDDLAASSNTIVMRAEAP